MGREASISKLTRRSKERDVPNPNQRCLAVIPARGGSKGIPRKNVRMVAGRPLIGWTIRAARAATRVDRVVVSTDDREIADVAAEYGAEVVWRPAEISGDAASSESALLHTLAELERTEGYTPELLAFLQCTSPLTAAQDIDGTIAQLIDANADTSLTVTPFHYFIWKDDGDGGAAAVNHDKAVRPRRQDRDPQYLETGAVYAMRTQGFLKSKHRFFGKTVSYVMPAERVFEIDEPRDLIVVESLLRLREEHERGRLLPHTVKAVVFDFDGVFTDNSVTVDQDGREAVVCRRDDGMGIARLREAGVPVLVLSAEVNPVVGARCRKLGIECVQGCGDKLPALADWAARRGVERAELVYVGNDVNDAECMAWAGCGIAVADAYPQALRAARLVLSRAGGHGAVREVCEMVIDAIGSGRRTATLRAA